MEYSHLLTEGHSGSAIMMSKLENKKQKYKIIGIHKA